MDLTEVAYCGLYCGLCASRRRIPQQAANLREVLTAEGYDRGYFDIPGLEGIFPAFWEGLNLLAERPCAGCRGEGGYPDCPIRICAKEREITVCSACAEFPCERLAMLHRYPTCLADNAWMRQVGLQRWIIEQEARAARGFAYADIRYPEPSAHQTGGDEK